MKEIGEYLETTRKENGVSLTEAAEDLELTTLQLENIESGNVRAFKDIYELRKYVQNYAKYLGLDPNEIIDSFNDFLFEHTSKISLDDIRAVKKKQSVKEKEKKVKSPYTKEYIEKKPVWPYFCIVLILLFVILLIYIIFTHTNHVPVRVDELRGGIYEFTY